ncbi:MAG: ZIP family metal transporter [Flavobacteriaceae bacterium]
MTLFNSFSYLLPFLGSLIGMVIAFYVRPKTPTSLKLILAFSGAFLLGITLFHLMPEVFNHPERPVGRWIGVGLSLQILLEYLSQGAEHGHSHLKSDQKFPLFLFLSLCIHAFVEGLPLSQQPELVWGIFIHKIPIGMVLFFIIWNSRSSTINKLFYFFLFALMSPIGGFVFLNFKTLINWQLPITSIVIGMLLHISTTILFESNQGHTFNFTKFITILTALGISYIL